VAVGPPAVISHESALELQNLSDVIPDRVHLTLPRAYRGRRSDLAQLHFTQRPPAAHELRTVDGVPVTSPERTIVDALESGTQPEQVEMAVVQALDRGLTTPKRLERAAEGRSAPTRGWVKKAAARLRHT
jgi:predicted transcriptional regulator of viral defense system